MAIERLREETRQTAEQLSRHLVMSMGVIAVLVSSANMKWKLPGWDDARRTEKQAEKTRDGLDPNDFPSEAEYRRAWNAADAKLQAAWRERSGLEDDTVE